MTNVNSTRVLVFTDGSLGLADVAVNPPSRGAHSRSATNSSIDQFSQQPPNLLFDLTPAIAVARSK